MTTLRNYMEREQRTCAIHYVTAEARIAQGDWEGAEAEFARFRQQFERHLGREELVLFPRLERAVGGTVVSTSLMRREHAQQRALIALMAESIARATRMNSSTSPTPCAHSRASTTARKKTWSTRSPNACSMAAAACCWQP